MLGKRRALPLIEANVFIRFGTGDSPDRKPNDAGPFRKFDQVEVTGAGNPDHVTICQSHQPAAKVGAVGST